MGYRTANIDRIKGEGLAFTDYYGQQSCGRIPRAVVHFLMETTALFWWYVARRGGVAWQSVP